LPFTFSNVRGTSEAAAFAVFLMWFREPDLSIRLTPKKTPLRDDLCEDTPAWWLLRKKKTMYMTGSNDSRSVRSIMQFMLGSTHGPKVFEKEEATFRDIQAYIRSLTPPPYPFTIDTALAKKGEAVFRKTCVTCHGTYGDNWTYPNKVVPLDVIGTDPNRANGLPQGWVEHYNKSWFAQEKHPDSPGGFKTADNKGYQAPPLDGVWATAPYLHNGSVPTVYHVLNSKARPAVYTRSFRTDEDAYDKEKLGWRFTPVSDADQRGMAAIEKRKVYDTRLSGRGNGGHAFGDDLTEDERQAVIEYLKTL
jgi:mono/diheme cytochrome c family protein